MTTFQSLMWIFSSRTHCGAWRRRCTVVPSEPLDFELLAGITEHRKPLFEKIAEERHAQKIAGGALIARAGGLCADRWPVGGGIVITPQPCQRDEIDLLV